MSAVTNDRDWLVLVHFRRLSAQTLIFGMGDAATRVAALLLLPVYTHILTPEEYGKLAIVTLVSAVVAPCSRFWAAVSVFPFLLSE